MIGRLFELGVVNSMAPGIGSWQATDLLSEDREHESNGRLAGLGNTNEPCSPLLLAMSRKPRELGAQNLLKKGQVIKRGYGGLIAFD
jgi:hypothetical protein